MGLLPHSARTTSCPPLYGCMPGLRDTHSCAVFVCSFVITSPSQSSAISSKPVYLSPSLFLPLWQSFFFFFSWHGWIPLGTRCGVGDKAVASAEGGPSVMPAEHNNLTPPFIFFQSTPLRAMISAFSLLRLYTHGSTQAVSTDSSRKISRFKKRLV